MYNYKYQIQPITGPRIATQDFSAAEFDSSHKINSFLNLNFI